MCFFFKQKTAYEMRISDWSSDVCSSDLHQIAYGPIDDEAANFFGHCRGAHQAADKRLAQVAAAIYDNDVARLRHHERLVYHQVIARTHLHGQRRTAQTQIDRKSTRLNSSH